MKFTFYLIIFSLLFSCSKKNQNTAVVSEHDPIEKVEEKIEYPIFHKNSSIPEKKIDIECNLITKIDYSCEKTENLSVSDFSLDSVNNFYFLDGEKCKIFKTDSLGNMIKVFSRRGSGPGETTNPVFIRIVSDTIFVGDHQQKKIIRYDLNGNFLSEKKSDDLNLETELDKGHLLSRFQKFENTEKNSKLIHGFQIRESKTDTIPTILWSDERELPFISYGRDFSPVIKADKSKIYIGDISENQFLINVFDASGLKTGVITKPYAKISYNQFDSKYHREKGVLSYGPANYKDLPEIKNKLALHDMMIDKDKNLWVYPAVERNEKNRSICYVDIFKEGKYLSRSELSVLDSCTQWNSGKYISLRKDKMYIKDIFSNCLLVYEYNLVEK
ncbi:MAG: hypothetical protein JXR48_04675 [Candidatus Delongbacteria bacterium]|nr:hypothetical protein [Candidatus Delongbacteria bacterium]MBN2834242.1 hypothetical protein [Candidatus Delongbacteria bacterium]